MPEGKGKVGVSNGRPVPIWVPADQTLAGYFGESAYSKLNGHICPYVVPWRRTEADLGRFDIGKVEAVWWIVAVSEAQQGRG